MLWSRFEYVASVPRTVPLEFSTWTWRVSNLAVVVVSAVSTCSQNDRFAFAHEDGIETFCDSVSVWVVP